MSTSLSLSRSRVRVVAGTASTLLFVGGLIAAGVLIALAALAVAGSVAGSLFAFSRASRRLRQHPSRS